MDIQQLTRQLHTKNDSKIVMLVADGLGGLPLEPGGKTELEAANTPNLDRLARRGVQGGSIPVLPGISPGSGPGHLGLFGYDPLTNLIGRGALEATGIGFELTERDVAIRANFCTLDADGNISDRRAGRIPTEESAPLAIKLREVKIDGIEIFVEPVKEHRFVIVFRGEGLGGNVKDTDPQATGVPPLEPEAADEASQKTAKVAAEFVRQAKELLAGQPKANACTLRGFSPKPNLPGYEEVYGLKAAAIAVYPMYKGLARLAGMDIVGDAKTLVITPAHPVETLPQIAGARVSRRADGAIAFDFKRSEVTPGAILDAVREAGIALDDVTSAEPDLEDVFLALTHDNRAAAE